MSERLTDKDIETIIKTFELHIIGSITNDGCDMVTQAFRQLQQENKKLKQWDINKDSRNSRQRVELRKLQRENKELKERIDKAMKKIKNELADFNHLSTPKVMEVYKILEGDN